MYDILLAIPAVTDPAAATATDPSVWVTLLQTAPLATICVILLVVVRHLYTSKEALHTSKEALQREQNAKLEEMANLLHDLNIINLEKSFESSKSWQEAFDKIEEGMKERFGDHIRSEEQSLGQINTCLSDINTLLKALKEHASTKLADHVKDIESKVDALQLSLQRRREDIREDHRRSRDELVRGIDDLLKKAMERDLCPKIQKVIEDLKGQVNGLPRR